MQIYVSLTRSRVCRPAAMGAACLLVAGLWTSACGRVTPAGHEVAVSAPDATSDAPSPETDAGIAAESGSDTGTDADDAAAEAGDVCANRLCGTVCGVEGVDLIDICLAGVCVEGAGGSFGYALCDYACAGQPCGTVCSTSGYGICDGNGQCVQNVDGVCSHCGPVEDAGSSSGVISENLIVNGDAEAAGGTPIGASPAVPAGWTSIGEATALAVIARSFKKNQSGTTTEIELVRPR